MTGPFTARLLATPRLVRLHLLFVVVLGIVSIRATPVVRLLTRLVPLTGNLRCVQAGAFSGMVTSGSPSFIMLSVLLVRARLLFEILLLIDMVEIRVVNFLRVIELMLLGSGLSMRAGQLGGAAVDLALIRQVSVPVVLGCRIFDAVCNLLLMVVSCDIKVTALVFKLNREIGATLIFGTVRTLLVLIAVEIRLRLRLSSVVALMASLAVAPVQVDAIGTLVDRRFGIVHDHLRLVQELGHVVILCRFMHHVMLAGTRLGKEASLRRIVVTALHEGVLGRAMPLLVIDRLCYVV